jgi:adenylate kinase
MDTIRTRPTALDHTAADTVLEQANTIFNVAWKQIRGRVEAGTARLPREIIWLGGAPGAGKGTNTPFILRERGIVAPPIVTSDLLNAPEMQRIKATGNLVGDADVVRLLFERLVEPLHTTGVVVDGFPRTRVQVECVKLLYQKMLDLRAAHRDTPLAAFFPKPMFQIVVLYVEEKQSVERQLKRGREIIAHNEKVRETGVGQLLEERVTDLNEESCRKRYRVFMEQTYSVLQSLKEVFHFHIIDAQGDIASVERAIMREFKYQSSLELDEETFDAIHRIPLASDIVVAARQRLVERLERYQRDSPDVFRRVIAVIETEFLPAITLHAMTGLAKLACDNELFADPLALSMLVDVLNERGYRTCTIVENRDVPTSVDLATGVVRTVRRPRYRFEIHFEGSRIRRGV